MKHQTRRTALLESQITEVSANNGPVGLSGVDRRRLQNRFNQRKSRQRKKQLLEILNGNSSNRKWIIYTDRPTSDDASKKVRSESTRFTENAVSAPLTQRQTGSEISEGLLHFCRLGPTERNAFISRLRDEALSGASQRSLRLELLISVKQYNIIVAMSANAASVGLSMESLCHDIPSPFNTYEPWSMSLPPSLWPTTLQRQISHHPWIDLFPMASVRNVLLKHEGKYDDEELCQDIFGSCGNDQGPVGMLIWGEAWDPLAYEISEKVIWKWFWLFQDCVDVIKSSNHWRARRGEEGILIPGYDCTHSPPPV